MLDDTTHPTIPNVDQAGNEVERALITRLNHLRQYIPANVFESDGYSLTPPEIEESDGLMDKVEVGMLNAMTEALGPRTEAVIAAVARLVAQ